MLVGVKQCRIEVEIRYRDSNGQCSERKIRIERVGAYDAGWVYLDAFCFKSNARRTFAADRIDVFIMPDGRWVDPRAYLTETLKVPLLKRELRMRDRSSWGR